MQIPQKEGVVSAGILHQAAHSYDQYLRLCLVATLAKLLTNPTATTVSNPIQNAISSSFILKKSVQNQFAIVSYRQDEPKGTHFREGSVQQNT